MLRFLRLLRLAIWRTLMHDGFAIAKGAAYSSILTLFPAFMLAGSILAASHTTADFLREISYAVGRIMPSGTRAAAQIYFESSQARPSRFLVFASISTLWIASGVMISWMEGFRRAYQFSKTWGLIKERLIAFFLVFIALVPMTFASLLVAFGNQSETWMEFHTGHEFAPYLLLIWTAVRWIISALTSIAVILLIYHFAVPRTLPWHSAMPGASLATALWFPATLLFGWYLRNYATYNLFYGSLGTAIAVLVWLYIVSIIILIGAEFNALIFPRTVLGQPSSEAAVAATRPSTP